MLYNTIGISKQAVAQYAKRQVHFDQKLSVLILEADELKKIHPGCGVEKMYYTLKPDFIGRDRFIDAFMQLGYRVKRHKNYKKTTIIGNLFYPNLIKGISISAPSKIWQSDITYMRVGENYFYTIFIIDVYTKKIVGHQVSDHMRAMANIKALKTALNQNSPPAIHHSDRGSQYASNQYVTLLEEKGIAVSMANSAQDNAYAERINRTIKEEYLKYWKPKSFHQLKRQVNKAVNHYNNQRPHRNLNRMSPTQFEKYWTSIPNETKPIITIFDNQLTK